MGYTVGVDYGRDAGMAVYAVFRRGCFHYFYSREEALAFCGGQKPRYQRLPFEPRAHDDGGRVGWAPLRD